LTVDIISKAFEGRATIRSAMQLLQKSRRIIECYLQQYKTKGLICIYLKKYSSS